MFMRLDLEPGSPVKQELLIQDYHMDLREPKAAGNSWPVKLRCRIPLHNAFFRWYVANEEKFAVRLEMLNRPGTCVDVSFRDINRVLTAQVIEDELTASVLSQRTYWDTILDFDTAPQPIPGGVMCDLCVEKSQRIFPTLEALWCDHLFEPFLACVNEKLAIATVVSITGTPNWFGSAKLLP